MGKNRKWKERPKAKLILTHPADRRCIHGVPAEQNPKFAKRTHKPAAR